MAPQRMGRPPRIEPQRYARRNVIERFFCALKEYRRVATRYDKHDQHILSMAQLTCIRRILRHHFSDAANILSGSGKQHYTVFT